ncbi:hypothetical protein [Streptomyces sp. NPDC017964]
MSDISDSYISPATLEQIRGVVVEWSRTWGEVSPSNIRVVSTNRDDAAELLRPGVRSEPAPCYLVFLEGCFRIAWTLKLPDTTKAWAALHIDPRFMSATSYTVRPLDDVPVRQMSDLGTVYALD